MNNTRDTAIGATRSCPHCRAQILASSSVCPACRHHLRFGGKAADAITVPDLVPLKVSGTVRHNNTGPAWEYSVVVLVKNARGEEVTRHVVGVGALSPGDERTFSLAVEVFTGR